MNFFLSFVFLIFTAWIFLFIASQNFTFRMIIRKLRWLVLSQWASSIVTLLGKTFLFVTGPLKILEKAKVGGSFAENWEIIKNDTYTFPFPWKEYKLKFDKFIVCYLLAIIVYTSLTYLHMYLGYILEDKIREMLINISLSRYTKISYLDTYLVKGKLLNILFLDIPLLSSYFGGSNKGNNVNQIFFQGGDAVLSTFILAYSLENKKHILTLLAIIFAALALITVLQRIIIKKEKRHRQSLDQESKKIDDLLNNIDLLKKKELSNVFLKEVCKIVENNTKKKARDKFLIVANGVFPNQFLPRFVEIIMVCLTLNFRTSQLSYNILKQLKGVFTATWDLPSVVVSNKNFVNFCQITKVEPKKPGLCLTEDIKKIEMRGIHFRYPNQEHLLENFNKTFLAGEITQLEGKNGTGKSTTILLILGLLKPQKGEITINDKYNLEDIDLELWRKHIVYASNQTLLKKGSEGEKQIKELESAISKNNYSFYDKERDSKVLILDESWNSMDKANRKYWKEKIDELTKNNQKITIVIEH